MAPNAYTNHPGKLTLLIDVDRIELELTDGTSGVRIAEVTIPGAEFLAALSRRAYVECSIALYHGPVGHLFEHKTVPILFPTGRNLHPVKEKDVARTRSIEDLALAPYCVDGWSPIHIESSADYRNHHRRNAAATREAPKGMEVYDVAFSRYVHPKTGRVWVPGQDQADLANSAPVLPYTAEDLDLLESDVTTADTALSSTSEETYKERDIQTARLREVLAKLRARLPITAPVTAGTAETIKAGL